MDHFTAPRRPRSTPSRDSRSPPRLPRGRRGSASATSCSAIPSATRCSWPRWRPRSTSSPTAGSSSASAGDRYRPSCRRTDSARSRRPCAAKLRETLEVLDLMFAGETFDYDGEHVQLHQAIGRPVPAQPRIPVHIGGGGPRLTMPLVERFADWWNCPGYALDRIDELRPLAGTARVSTQHPIGLAPDSASRDEVIAHRAPTLRIVGRGDRGGAPTRSGASWRPRCNAASKGSYSSSPTSARRKRSTTSCRRSRRSCGRRRKAKGTPWSTRP